MKSRVGIVRAKRLRHRLIFCSRPALSGRFTRMLDPGSENRGYKNRLRGLETLFRGSIDPGSENRGYNNRLRGLETLFRGSIFSTPVRRTEATQSNTYRIKPF
jgi:hypothetical protein